MAREPESVSTDFAHRRDDRRPLGGHESHDEVANWSLSRRGAV